MSTEQIADHAEKYEHNNPMGAMGRIGADLNLIYDLGKYPASWDFLHWLIAAEVARKKLGKATLGVCFLHGSNDGFRDDYVKRPLSAKKAILENVMRPALDLVGAVEVDTGLNEVLPYQTYVMVGYAKAGNAVPTFAVPEDAMEEVHDYLGNRKPLVVTLREASYYPERNSNLDAWLAFARLCNEESVIFVRDTEKADEPLKGFETCPRASKELHFRAALMAHAKCNLMIATGPAGLPVYSNWPWLMFGAYRPDLPDYTPGHEKWLKEQMGIGLGGQFPWSSPCQRFVWERDNYSMHIMQAWQDMKPLLPA